MDSIFFNVIDTANPLFYLIITYTYITSAFTLRNNTCQAYYVSYFTQVLIQYGINIVILHYLSHILIKY